MQVWTSLVNNIDTFHRIRAMEARRRFRFVRAATVSLKLPGSFRLVRYPGTANAASPAHRHKPRIDNPIVPRPQAAIPAMAGRIQAAFPTIASRREWNRSNDAGNPAGAKHARQVSSGRPPSGVPVRSD
jgi:hypothetical protein